MMKKYIIAAACVVAVAFFAIALGNDITLKAPGGVSIDTRSKQNNDVIPPGGTVKQESTGDNSVNVSAPGGVVNIVR